MNEKLLGAACMQSVAATKAKKKSNKNFRLARGKSNQINFSPSEAFFFCRKAVSNGN